MPNTAQRHFLGWPTRPLRGAAMALVERFGAGLSDVFVAVPGARAGRGLDVELRRVAEAAGLRAWTPPRIMTQGRLVDELLRLEGARADRSTRTLAWARALRETLPAGSGDLLERTPEASDTLGWLRLAERVRTLHAELADAGSDFRALAEGDALAPFVGASDREQRRWRVLAAVQGRWREILKDAQLVDPHDARNHALAENAVVQGRAVALVGIVDGPGLLRRTLAALEPGPEAFVLAPASEARGFDALGFCVPEYWLERDLPLGAGDGLERWHIVVGPAEEAELAARLVAHRVVASDASGAPLTAADVTIGVTDEAVIPYLERRFGADGVRARPAAGLPLEHTPPAKLLEALATWLEGRTASAAAALVRHPDLEVHLTRALHPDPTSSRGIAPDLPSLFDRIRATHVPAVLDTSLPEGVREADRALLGATLDAVRALLGPLAERRDLALADGVVAVRSALIEVYAGRDLEGEPDQTTAEQLEAIRVLRAALAALGEVLDDLARVPPMLAGTLDPVSVLRLVVRTVRGRSVPPAPVDPAVPTIEVLGWLELPLDPAPLLIVTDFVEGAVPTAPAADPFLPDSLRARLGLESDQTRAARDAYVAATLVATRSVDFISPRRTAEGDPRFPSRLAFHAAPEAVLRRVEFALRPALLEVSVTDPTAAAAQSYRRPVLRPREERDVFSVTDFRAFLDSPYRFALERLLRAEELQDEVHELDPRSFGTLLHEAARVLGEEAHRASTDARALQDALLGRLEHIALALYGRAPEPAVRLQLEQAEMRLVHLANWQAERARRGWRVEHVEWAPPLDDVHGRRRHAVPLPMDPGAAPAWLAGKIDRIDVHVATGRLSILDYKSGAKATLPKKALKVPKDGASGPESLQWNDPQLALYCHLAASLLRSAKGFPELGYLSLTASEAQWNPVPEDDDSQSWERAGAVDSALHLARGIVAKVRAGDYDSIGKASNWRAGLARELVGVGFTVAPDEGETDDEEDASDGRN